MTERMFDHAGLTRAVQDVLNVRRVFGEPYERDGRLVVPVARVSGATGAAAGRGRNDAGAEADSQPATGSRGEGGSGGFAARVKPLGVYVVDDDGAHWRPALDLNRVILGGQVVGAVVGCTLALVWALRRRR